MNPMHMSGIIYDHFTHEYTYQVIEPVLSEPEKDLLKELKERLFETLDINTKDISKEEARRQLRNSVDEILADFGIKPRPIQREKILYDMHKDFLGDGLIDAIMHDKYIEDISCDGVNTPIFAFHASYESMKTTLMYHNAEDARFLCHKTRPACREVYLDCRTYPRCIHE